MLLDTSGLLCFFDESDPRHTQPVAAIQPAKAPLLTYNNRPRLFDCLPRSEQRGRLAAH